MIYCLSCIFIFFFKDTATTEIYPYLHPLSLHDALPISARPGAAAAGPAGSRQYERRHGDLWVSASSSQFGRLYRLDPADGRVLAQFEMPAGTEDQIGRAHV